MSFAVLSQSYISINSLLNSFRIRAWAMFLAAVPVAAVNFYVNIFNQKVNCVASELRLWLKRQIVFCKPFFNGSLYCASICSRICHVASSVTKIVSSWTQAAVMSFYNFSAICARKEIELSYRATRMGAFIFVGAFVIAKVISSINTRRPFQKINAALSAPYSHLAVTATRSYAAQFIGTSARTRLVSAVSNGRKEFSAANWTDSFDFCILGFTTTYRNISTQARAILGTRRRALWCNKGLIFLPANLTCFCNSWHSSPHKKHPANDSRFVAQTARRLAGCVLP